MSRPLILPAVIAALFGASSAAADALWVRPKAKEGYSYPECYCTNRGERIEMGGMTCIRIGSTEYLARCGMSLNNPAWRKVEDGCPPAAGASLNDRLKRLQPG